MLDAASQLVIKVIYKYKEYTQTANVARYSTIRDIRKALEKKIRFSVKQMKLMYKNNNILEKAESTKVYNYFGDVKEIVLDVQHKDFTEDDFIEQFEKAFANVQRPTEEDDTRSKKLKHLKPALKDKTFNPQFSDRPVCNYDNTNEAKYICLKCSQYWCEYCMKFEVHKSDLCAIKDIDSTLKYKRDLLMKELSDKITNDAYYTKLEKIDFLLNEKVSVIDKQFNDMINIIQKIKESQMKFVIDYFYQKVSDKKYKALTKDTDFFAKTVNDIEKNYNPESIEENIKNSQTIRTGLDIIIKKFEEFKQRYTDFDNVYIQYDNFNQTFLSQLEAKIGQSANVGREISNPELMESEVKFKQDVDTNIKEKAKGTCLIKIKYYNSIMVWNHLNQKLIRINDFKDRFEFKLNYQVYAGNIFLNLKNLLYIITGSNFNMFYFYDPKLNEIFRLPSLSDNHCRGGMIYLEFYNSIFCISGKYTKKVEYFNLQALKKAYVKNNSSLDSKTLNRTKSINNKSVKESKNTSFEMDYTKDDKMKWDDFPSLNVARNYASFFVYNNNYLYVFFGYNQNRGYLDTIERIDLQAPKAFEYVKYHNPKELDLKLNSMGVCFANADEIYILGGTIRERFTDQILKYNFKQDTFFLTDFTIPSMHQNEYYRFWEESTFIPLTSKGNTANSDDAFTFGMIDARDKVHLFNIKTFKYNII